MNLATVFMSELDSSCKGSPNVNRWGEEETQAASDRGERKIGFFIFPSTCQFSKICDNQVDGIGDALDRRQRSHALVSHRVTLACRSSTRGLRPLFPGRRALGEPLIFFWVGTNFGQRSCCPSDCSAIDKRERQRGHSTCKDIG